MPRIRKTVYVGVDPGAGGGVVALASRKVVVAAPMPDTERDLWDLVLEITDHGKATAIIERVHSMPAQGVASSFTFGLNYGRQRMALIAAGIPFDEVTPVTWMRALRLPPRKSKEKGAAQRDWKRKLKAKAQQWFPDQKVTLKTADAFLIAEYCRRFHEGLL